MKELMNERRDMYEYYWAFEAEKWTKIDSINIRYINLQLTYWLT